MLKMKFKLSALYLWLPLYLNDSLGYSPFTAGLFSTLFDIGGAAGGPILGFLSDKHGKTLRWIFKSCLAASVAFIVVTYAIAKSVVFRMSPPVT